MGGKIRNVVRERMVSPLFAVILSALAVQERSLNRRRAQDYDRSTPPLTFVLTGATGRLLLKHYHGSSHGTIRTENPITPPMRDALTQARCEVAKHSIAADSGLTSPRSVPSS